MMYTLYHINHLNIIKKSDDHLIITQEAPPRFELGIRVLQTHALPLGYSAIKKSGLRGSNSLPPPWQGGALPDELNPHIFSPRHRSAVPHSFEIFKHLMPRLFTRSILFISFSKCLRTESNHRHGDFQSPALPTELQRHLTSYSDERPG